VDSCICGDKFGVIWNGVCGKLWNFIPAKNGFIERYSLPVEKIVISFAGIDLQRILRN
jgi:hypothetical protein